MIADLRPYQEYKESSSPWLTMVSSHWEVRNFRTLIRAFDVSKCPLISIRPCVGVRVTVPSTLKA
jgi:hypothetical protein